MGRSEIFTFPLAGKIAFTFLGQVNLFWHVTQLYSTFNSLKNEFDQGQVPRDTAYIFLVSCREEKPAGLNRDRGSGRESGSRLI